MAELVLVDVDRATSVTTSVLEGFGAGALAARRQAVHLVEGDLRGRPSHGLQRLPTLVSRIRNGVLIPDAEPVLHWTTPAALAVDGRAGFGPHVAYEALGELLARSKSTGVAVAAIRSAGHLGMLAPYVEEAASDGALAIVLTTSEALVHPAGAARAMVGTNPIAIGVPAQPHPFILDMSTAAISAGEVIAHEQRGLALPPGVAVDAEGRATTDASLARAGAVSPFGGAKGFGLGLGFELLVASLTGTALGTDVRGTLDVSEPVTKGDVLIVVRPDVFGAGGYEPLISDYLSALRDLPPAPESAGVLIPGDGARARRERHLEGGVPLPAALWEQLSALADESASNAKSRRVGMNG